MSLHEGASSDVSLMECWDLIYQFKEVLKLWVYRFGGVLRLSFHALMSVKNSFWLIKEYPNFVLLNKGVLELHFRPTEECYDSI